MIVSPPWERPHGFWYIRGPRGCAMGLGFLRTYMRYLLLD